MRKPLCLVAAILMFSLFAQASFSPPVKDTSSVRYTYSLPGSLTPGYYFGKKLFIKEELRLYRYTGKLITAVNNDGDAKLKVRANGKAKWGYIFALAGFLLIFCFVPGYLLSHRALKLEKQHPGILTEKNAAHARGGVKASITGVVLYALFAVTLFAIVAATHGCK